MRYTIVFALFLTFSFTNHSLAVAVPPTINVAPGESVQKAIDSAPDGSTIDIAAGVFPENITIIKPLTLVGAGPDKTSIKPDKPLQYAQAEKDAFFKNLEAARTPAERTKLAMEIAGVSQRPTITVKSAKGVALKDLKIQGLKIMSDGRELSADSLVVFNDSQASMTNCAVVGPFMNGVDISHGSDVQIDHCLIAGLWGTGVQVYSGERGMGIPAKLHLTDSDIRNCYSRCVTINCEGTTIEKCRISGSAWHGIRYDDCSPTVTGNQIFANARSGIYASGKTAATVRDNIFSKNEMDGMSCWFDNNDTIEHNTFADNLREGIAVLGNSTSTLSSNVFVNHPIAVMIGKISERNGQSVGPALPKLDANNFWQNKSDVQLDQKDQPAPAGSKSQDPKLADAAIAPSSPWPIQPEENAMIPDSETRDYAKWKTVAQR